MSLFDEVLYMKCKNLKLWEDAKVIYMYFQN